MTIRVRVIATECGRRLEAKTSRKQFTSRSVHSIYMVSISLLKIDRDFARKIYEDSIFYIRGTAGTLSSRVMAC